MRCKPAHAYAHATTGVAAAAMYSSGENQQRRSAYQHGIGGWARPASCRAHKPFKVLHRQRGHIHAAPREPRDQPC
jgi:hypothetical protein